MPHFPQLFALVVLSTSHPSCHVLLQFRKRAAYRGGQAGPTSGGHTSGRRMGNTCGQDMHAGAPACNTQVHTCRRASVLLGSQQEVAPTRGTLAAAIHTVWHRPEEHWQLPFTHVALAPHCAVMVHAPEVHTLGLGWHHWSVAGQMCLSGQSGCPPFGAEHAARSQGRGALLLPGRHGAGRSVQLQYLARAAMLLCTQICCARSFVLLSQLAPEAVAHLL